MWMTNAAGNPVNRWSAGISSGPPASWMSRKVPAISGMADSAIRAAGTGQLRDRSRCPVVAVLIGP